MARAKAQKEIEKLELAKFKEAERRAKRPVITKSQRLKMQARVRTSVVLIFAFFLKVFHRIHGEVVSHIVSASRIKPVFTHTHTHRWRYVSKRKRGYIRVL